MNNNAMNYLEEYRKKQQERWRQQQENNAQKNLETENTQDTQIQQNTSNNVNEMEQIKPNPIEEIRPGDEQYVERLLPDEEFTETQPILIQNDEDMIDIEREYKSDEQLARELQQKFYEEDFQIRQSSIDPQISQDEMLARMLQEEFNQEMDTTQIYNEPQRRTQGFSTIRIMRNIPGTNQFEVTETREEFLPNEEINFGLDNFFESHRQMMNRIFENSLRSFPF